MDRVHQLYSLFPFSFFLLPPPLDSLVVEISSNSEKCILSSVIRLLASSLVAWLQSFNKYCSTSQLLKLPGATPQAPLFKVADIISQVNDFLQLTYHLHIVLISVPSRPRSSLGLKPCKTQCCLMLLQLEQLQANRLCSLPDPGLSSYSTEKQLFTPCPRP